MSDGSSGLLHQHKSRRPLTPHQLLMSMPTAEYGSGPQAAEKPLRRSRARSEEPNRCPGSARKTGRLSAALTFMEIDIAEPPSMFRGIHPWPSRRIGKGSAYPGPGFDSATRQHYTAASWSRDIRTPTAVGHAERGSAALLLLLVTATDIFGGYVFNIALSKRMFDVRGSRRHFIRLN